MASSAHQKEGYYNYNGDCSNNIDNDTHHHPQPPPPPQPTWLIWSWTICAIAIIGRRWLLTISGKRHKGNHAINQSSKLSTSHWWPFTIVCDRKCRCWFFLYLLQIHVSLGDIPNSYDMITESMNSHQVTQVVLDIDILVVADSTQADNRPGPYIKWRFVLNIKQGGKHPVNAWVFPTW